VSYPHLVGHGWLKFPLQDTTAYDAALASIADRSGSPLDPDPSTRLDVFHRKDGVVLAYTGEKGETSFGRRCRGYRNAENTAFAINGHYVGQDCGAGPNPAYLSYDGSPGYEFAIPKLTPIYAPAAGELFKAWIDPVNPSKACPGLTAWDAAHTFYIDHGNGYSSWFLKADALDPSIEAQIGSDYSKSAHVNAGDRIAFSGSFGHCGTPDSLPSGLAFEMRQGLTDVVDPYAEGFWIEP
jgi:hypothetical protein